MIGSWFGMFGIYTSIFGQTHCAGFFSHLPGSLDFNKGATPSPLPPPPPRLLHLLHSLPYRQLRILWSVPGPEHHTVSSGCSGARLGPKACQRECQTECQNRCQTECQKRMSERLPDKMSEQMADRMPEENVRI